MGPGNEHTPPGTTAAPVPHARLYTGAAGDCIYFSVALYVIMDLGVIWFPLQVFRFAHEDLLN